MPATTDYLATLKIQLDAAAANKKIALDTAYERATNAVFDAEGKMSTRKTPAGNDAGPGTLDVQYAEQQRNIDTANEASGTLKSGQYGRDLATSQAGYRSTVAGLNADRIAGGTAAYTDAASEYAKYMAMYGTPTPDPKTTPTTGGGGTSGGAGAGSGSGGAGAGSGGAGAGGGSDKDPTGNSNYSGPPGFPDLAQQQRPTSNIPSKGTYSGSKAAAADVNKIKTIISNKNIPAAPVKKLVPVLNKIKTIKNF
jgi:hypothetical protein